MKMSIELVPSNTESVEPKNW